ncbi:hypothetical protein O181_098711 [Austropuccinia psidii MF-1]|uniref:NTF2 domain-containing protein n=1 Tax=Austropuccinia psidii MF-1 TaxID=1389203 RepID=A0A9Q3PG75_9BASI|nr:hypothetical protein [Austropuccinia psidii MF-1]
MMAPLSQQQHPNSTNPHSSNHHHRQANKDRYNDFNSTSSNNELLNRLEIKNHHQNKLIITNTRNRHGQTSLNRPNNSRSKNFKCHRSSKNIINQNSIQNESAIDVLRKLIQSRWDPVTKLLDLSNLPQDKILKSAGILAPGQKGAPIKTAGAIWKLCQEMYPNVRSISLADNNLKSLQPMSLNSLAITLPQIVNLSLAGNQLSSFTDLNSISPTINQTISNHQNSKLGLNHLRELILSGNPLRVKAEKDGTIGLQHYLIEACSRFPNLEILDGETIDPSIKSNLPLKIPTQQNTITQTSLSNISSINSQHLIHLNPIPIKPAFLGDQSTSAFASAFCLQFFTAFDQNRDSLIDVYATKSSFSLSASPSVPLRAKMAGLTRNRPEMPAQSVPPWHDYIIISRNFAKLKGPKLCDRLANGPAEIVKHIKSIPRTKHDLTVNKKFIVDAWQMPGLVSESTSTGGAVIYLTIHGEFQELPSMTFRSFDRTFVLGSAGPASAAAIKGWPCVILSDQLNVRGYSCPSAWSPEERILNLTTNLSIEQENLTNQLMKATKLTQDFAIECLNQNNWNLLKALKNFEEIKSIGILPPNAFLSS